MGILPKSRKFSGEIILTGGRKSRPEACGSRLRPRSRVRDRTVLTPEGAGRKQSARVPPSLPGPTLAAGTTCNLRCAPRPPPGKIHLRRTGSPQARQEGPKGLRGRGNLALNQIVQSDAFGSPLFKMKNCKNSSINHAARGSPEPPPAAPTPPANQTGFLVIKFLGKKKTGGCSARVLLGQSRIE